MWSLFGLGLSCAGLKSSKFDITVQKALIWKDANCDQMLKLQPPQMWLHVSEITSSKVQGCSKINNETTMFQFFVVCCFLQLRRFKHEITPTWILAIGKRAEPTVCAWYVNVWWEFLIWNGQDPKNHGCDQALVPCLFQFEVADTRSRWNHRTNCVADEFWTPSALPILFSEIDIDLKRATSSELVSGKVFTVDVQHLVKIMTTWIDLLLKVLRTFPCGLCSLPQSTKSLMFNKAIGKQSQLRWRIRHRLVCHSGRWIATYYQLES